MDTTSRAHAAWSFPGRESDLFANSLQFQRQFLNPSFHPLGIEPDPSGCCRIDGFLAGRNGGKGVAQEGAVVGELGQAVVKRQQVAA